MVKDGSGVTSPAQAGPARVVQVRLPASGTSLASPVATRQPSSSASRTGEPGLPSPDLDAEGSPGPLIIGLVRERARAAALQLDLDFVPGLCLLPGLRPGSELPAPSARSCVPAILLLCVVTPPCVASLRHRIQVREPATWIRRFTAPRLKLVSGL